MKATIILKDGVTAIALVPESENDQMALAHMGRYESFYKSEFSRLSLKTQQLHSSGDYTCDKVPVLIGKEYEPTKSVAPEEQKNWSINDIRVYIEMFKREKVKKKNISFGDWFEKMLKEPMSSVQ